MNNVFRDYIDCFVVVYLDDIVVYSDSLDEHLDHLRKVLSTLRTHQLYVKPKKCEFGCVQITFLGHIICNGEVRMNSKKIQAIIDWPAPKKVTELRSFLGLANYFRRFIEGYSREVAVLTDLLKKDRPWNWSERCQECFDRLKHWVSSEPVLKLPDFEESFEVHTDASDRLVVF